MRVGQPVAIPELPPIISGGRFDKAAAAAHQRWLEGYAKEHVVMCHGWADGIAFYEVRGSTLHHIPSFGSYELPGYLIRGLRRGDAERLRWRPG